MQKQLYTRLRKARRKKNTGNNSCADCKTANATWTSFSLGVFLCMQCAGVHRSLGTHISKVKSSTTDAWTERDVETMENVGNRIANSYWEAMLDEHDPQRINEFSSPTSRESFIKKKYAEREWVSSDSGGIPYLLKEEHCSPRRRRSRRGVDAESESSEASSTATSSKWEGGIRRRGANPSPWVSTTSVAKSQLPPMAPTTTVEPSEKPRRRRRRNPQVVEEETPTEPQPQPPPQQAPPSQTTPTQPSSLFSGMTFANGGATPPQSSTPQTQQPIVAQPVAQPTVAAPKPQQNGSNLLDFGAMDQQAAQRKRAEAERAAQLERQKAQQSAEDLSDLMAASVAPAIPAMGMGFRQHQAVSGMYPVAQPQYGGNVVVMSGGNMAFPQGMTVHQMVQLPNGTFVPLAQAQQMMIQQQQRQVIQQQANLGHGTSPQITPMPGPQAGLFSPPTVMTNVVAPNVVQGVGLTNVGRPRSVSSVSASPSPSSSAFSFVSPGMPNASGSSLVDTSQQHTFIHPVANGTYADPFHNVTVPSATESYQEEVPSTNQTMVEEQPQPEPIFRTVNDPAKTQTFVEEDKAAANDIFGKLFHEQQAEQIQKHFKIGDVVLRKGQYGTIHQIDFQTNPPTCVVRMHNTNNFVNTEFSFITKAPEEMQPKTGEIVSTVDMSSEPEPKEKTPPQPDAATAVLSIPDAWGFSNIARPKHVEVPSIVDEANNEPAEQPSVFGFVSGNGNGNENSHVSEVATSQTVGLTSSGQPSAFGFAVGQSDGAAAVPQQMFSPPQPQVPSHQPVGVIGGFQSAPTAAPGRIPDVQSHVQPQPQMSAFGFGQQQHQQPSIQPSANGFGFAQMTQSSQQPAPPTGSVFGFMNP